MSSRFIVCFIFAILFLSFEGYSQKWKLRRYEALYGVGTAHYFGDIGGSADESNWFGIKDIEILGTRPSFYVGARYKIRQNIAVKLNLTYGFISGNDNGSKNNDRNYAFYSHLFEPSFQGEFSIISEEQRYRSNALFNSRGMLNNYSRINVYIYAGIGGVYSNPKAKEDFAGSERFNPNQKFGLAFPMGVGFKFVLSSYMSVGFELGGRFTTTDYLDGYASEWTNVNDVYYLGIVNAVYRIKTSREGYPILFSQRRGRF